MDIETLRMEYNSRRENYLINIIYDLENYLKKNITYDRIDKISVRAKDVEKFLLKAQKINKDGNFKYNDPMNQIQDQIGARIVTYYVSDVPNIRDIIKDYFRYIEEKLIVPDSIKEFGYEGVHFILFIPEDIIPNDDFKNHAPKFFELQIKTLFQHAWSEAEHDLNYKSCSELDSETKRQIAFTAAQAWGADHIFNELFQNINKIEI